MEYIKVKKSGIHNRGVFARSHITKGTRIIEYVGEKVTKAEADRRAHRVFRDAQGNPTKGAVYIFTLNKRYDIDGNVSYNPARYINHSCEPNCEAVIDRGHIWIEAIRDIEKDEELSYNYGYDWDEWEDHPCRCGTDACVGFILDEEHWPRLRKELKRRSAQIS